MAKIIAHFMIFADIMLNDKALYLHTILEVFTHKYFWFQKRRVQERQQKSRWKGKATMTYQKVKTQRSLSMKAVQTTDNGDVILNFIICTAYILHILQ